VAAGIEEVAVATSEAGAVGATMADMVAVAATREALAAAVATMAVMAEVAYSISNNSTMKADTKEAEEAGVDSILGTASMGSPLEQRQLEVKESTTMNTEVVEEDTKREAVVSARTNNGNIRNLKVRKITNELKVRQPICLMRCERLLSEAI